MENRRPTFLLCTAIAAAAAAALPGSVPPAPRPVVARLVPQAALQVTPAALAFCRRAAYLLHDVTWATACDMRGEESIDCTLPDGVAAKVNLVLVSEERRCLAVEARASP